MSDHFEIIKSTTSPRDLAGIKMGNTEKYFGNMNVFRTKDEALAKDIKQKFGQEGTSEVLVARVPDRTTGKSFAFPRIPWHKESGAGQETNKGETE